MSEERTQKAESIPTIEVVDSETDFRAVGRSAAILVTILSVGLSAFHFYTAGFGVLSETLHRSTHLAVSMGLIFILFKRPSYKTTTASWLLAIFFITSYVFIALETWAATELPISDFRSILFIAAVTILIANALPKINFIDRALKAGGAIPFSDWILAILGASFSLYLIIFFDEIFVSRVSQPIATDFLYGALGMVLVVEATRRCVGPSLPIIGLLCLLFALMGPELPDGLAHRGFSITRIINHLYLGTEGIYGVALGVVATFVFHFVLFGVLAQASGLGELFISLSTSVAGRFSGGPAKVSVVASSMFGMISGSTIANTVTTGSLTIPLMKRVGFRPAFAGAVEASASAGGQITPPIMGAAAFVMAETLGMPYIEVILIAALPAALHYLSIFVSVHFEAKRLGLGGLPANEIPKAWDVFVKGWHLLIPPLVMIALLLMRYTPFLAAFWGIILVVAVSYIPLMTKLIGRGPTAGTVMTPKHLINGFEEGAKFTLAITATCACVGFILGTVTLTGIGFKFSAAVLTAAQAMASAIDILDIFDLVDERSLVLFCALIFTALACILMGCGIPTVPLYIILSAIIAPALYDYGVPLLATHFAVFYFGLLSDLTPPLALAAFAAAGIAGADPMHTAVIGFRLSIAKLLVPFMFVYTPAMLFFDFNAVNFTIGFSSGILSILFIASGFTGYFATTLHPIYRGLLLLSGLALIFGSFTVLLIVGFMGTVILGINVMASRAQVKVA